MALTVLAAPTSEELEEYAVWSTAIRELYIEDKVHLLVIRDRTKLDKSAKNNLGSAAQRWNLGAEVVKDFQAKNMDSHSLGKWFRLPITYTLISRADVDNFFVAHNLDGTGWDLFYAKYPKSQGIIWVSRPGFNNSMNQAILYIANRRHWLAGTGYLLLLTKQDGVWVVKDKLLVWIS